jgi:hypothetical protein
VFLCQQTFAAELTVCLRKGAGDDLTSALHKRMDALVDGHVRSCHLLHANGPTEASCMPPSGFSRA